MFKNRIMRTIMLNPKDVKGFVHEAEQCDFDIDISYNRYVVDAKSILGVFGLDLTKPLTVAYYGYNAKFERFIQSHAVAC